MDEIRCPMCGNLNPSDLEECQYCQARLKPLIVSQPPEEELGEQERRATSSEEESLPDWLKDLREEEPAPEQEDFETGGEDLDGEADEADWLARLQEQSLIDEDEAEEAEEQPFDDDASLLDRLSEGEPVEQTAEYEQELFPESQEAEVELPSDEQIREDEELPAWLSEIGADDDSVDQDQGGVAEPADESEHDVASEGQETEADWPSSEQIPEEDEELPAWLSGIDAEEISTEHEDSEIEALVQDAVPQDEEPPPDWMTDIEPSEEEEEPVWLPQVELEASEIKAEGTDEEPVPEKDDESESEEPEEPVMEEKQPDWLKGLEPTGAEKVSPFEERADMEAEEPDAEEDELPDWLVDLQEDGAEEEELEEIPDWLSAAELEKDAETDGELPEWMDVVKSGDEEEVETSEEETPDWLVSLDEEVQETMDSPLEEEQEGTNGEETPEWLSELEQEFSQESVPAFAVEDEEQEDIEGEVPPFAIEEEDEEFLESMPEWAEEVSIEEEDAEAQEPELEEAELPSWLEAMRPVEAVAPDTLEEAGEEAVETSGPLAGLSGILAAESDFARVRKPPSYSVKLRVTENQQARIALLREMLSTENKQKELPSQPVITPQYIFRLVIAIALILPILWSVISGTRLTPMPEPAAAPTGVLDVHRQIENQLSANSPVLIAFDYETGFSGELDIPTSAVLSHLMERGAYLTMVSTTPSGPMLAERLIERLNQTEEREGNPYANYSNMGYVPGGTAGLLSLAQAPPQTVPYTLNNLVVWESAPLNLISTMADFSMVLVITENPDTARAWIEQVQPTLQTNETPLIMILSAQAEPLVRPYYDGVPKQVNGLVVGLPGGAAYESVNGQSGLARRAWDAFSLSTLIAELVLVVGAAASLGTMLFNSNEKEEV